MEKTYEEDDSNTFHLLPLKCTVSLVVGSIRRLFVPVISRSKTNYSSVGPCNVSLPSKAPSKRSAATACDLLTWPGCAVSLSDRKGRQRLNLKPPSEPHVIHKVAALRAAGLLARRRCELADKGRTIWTSQ